MMNRVADMIEANAMHIIVIMMLVVVLSMAMNRVMDKEDHDE